MFIHPHHNSGQRRLRHQAGFTLVELMVVAAVFSITVLVATAVFVNVQSFQRGISGRQRVVADGRYVLEAMARTAKLGLPDYKFYANGYTVPCANANAAAAPPPPCNLNYPQSMLVTRDQANQQTCYRLNASSRSLETSSDCTGLAAVWNDITPSDLEINDFRVYIQPGGDPYRLPPAGDSDCKIAANWNQISGVCTCAAAGDCSAGQTCADTGSGKICKNPDSQPTVTIYLNTRSPGRGPGETADSTMQTTVASRVYRR